MLHLKLHLELHLKLHLKLHQLLSLLLLLKLHLLLSLKLHFGGQTKEETKEYSWGVNPTLYSYFAEMNRPNKPRRGDIAQAGVSLCSIPACVPSPLRGFGCASSVQGFRFAPPLPVFLRPFRALAAHAFAGVSLCSTPACALSPLRGLFG